MDRRPEVAGNTAVTGKDEQQPDQLCHVEHFDVAESRKTSPNARQNPTNCDQSIAHHSTKRTAALHPPIAGRRPDGAADEDVAA